MTINFAIIGCGYIAHRHARHIIDHPEADLVGGFDILPERTKEFGNKYICKAYTSLDELLNDKIVDIVVIATPNGAHANAAIETLKAGKHVLVEKPMALSVDDCNQMVETAEKFNAKLFVVKQNRFNPPVAALKNLMKENKLGKVFAVTTNCYWNRNKQYYENSEWKGTKALDGGTLFMQFSHFIDVLFYLFGKIEVVAGMTENAVHKGLTEFEDTGCFLLKFPEHKAQGSFNFTTGCFEQNMEGSIAIFAENATIKIGGKYLNTIDYQATNGFDITNLPVSAPANDYGYYQGSMSNHDKVIANVVATLKGKETIMTSGKEGAQVVKIIEQMYETALRG